jgi:hypothetical protein
MPRGWWEEDCIQVVDSEYVRALTGMAGKVKYDFAYGP